MTAIAVDDAVVRFGAVTALAGVSLSFDPATVTGMIGPNGAGKTTLFDVVSGFVAPVAGRVMLGDRDVTRWRPHRRARAGLRRTFQGGELFDDLDVTENLVVARAAGVDVPDLLEELALTSVAGELAGSLPAGIRRRVAIARALAGAPRALLLDEPGAGLGPDEVDDLAESLRRMATERGIAVVLVDHDMALIGRACSVVHVLNFGRVLVSGTPDHVQRHAAVLEAYLGA